VANRRAAYDRYRASVIADCAIKANAGSVADEHTARPKVREDGAITRIRHVVETVAEKAAMEVATMQEPSESSGEMAAAEV
jgi:hypothetical protein